MVHLRIVAPSPEAAHALDLLKATDSVINLIHLERAAQKPEGDVILCDVAREDASVIISDLKEFGIDKDGSIAIEELDSMISDQADAAEKAARGFPTDAVVWEEVESRTQENTELSGSFIVFFVLSCLLAVTAILLDSPILIIGAMVVGPEFGPIAAISVAIVQRRGDLVKRSLIPLAVGFPIGIAAAYLYALAIRTTDLTPDGFESGVHPNTQFISSPDEFSLFVAILAGAAGVLSLTHAKSGALVGVLISVTTIPAAANIGLAAAYQNGEEAFGAAQQLALNLGALILTGVVTLFIQRRLYQRRRIERLHHSSREQGGLPMGKSRRSKPSMVSDSSGDG
jgi:uncharacterized hydrophobic protein (TIGR00271 family)